MNHEIKLNLNMQPTVFTTICHTVRYHYPIGVFTPFAMSDNKRKINPIWSKAANEFLISEIVIGEPTRCCSYARIGYGNKSVFWESIANALKTRTAEFATSSFPSAKSCCTQFEKLLKERQDAKKNHKFLSGTTEELDEIACGLEDIMQEMEAVADENAAKDDGDEKVESDQRGQENHLKSGRGTPKSAKKVVAQTPVLEGTPVVQKSTVETLLSEILIRRAERSDEKASIRKRKMDLEERKMQLEEDEFNERKRARCSDIAKDDF